jgi:hypothetical protein
MGMPSDLAPTGFAQVSLGFKTVGLDEFDHPTDVEIDNGVFERQASRFDDIVDDASNLEPSGTCIRNDGRVDCA